MPVSILGHLILQLLISSLCKDRIGILNKELLGFVV